MAQVLREQGYVVDEAAEGLEAWHLLTTAAVLPAVVISDGQMPTMCGAELVERMRRDETLGRIPVAVITGKADSVPGATRVVVKPIYPEALIRLVAELCVS